MIKEKIINLSNFEGSADQVAEQLFEQLIAPMLNEMNKVDKNSGKLFSFSVMWLAMGAYANQFPKDKSKESIEFAVKKFTKTLDEFYLVKKS